MLAFYILRCHKYILKTHGRICSTFTPLLKNLNWCGTAYHRPCWICMVSLVVCKLKKNCKQIHQVTLCYTLLVCQKLHRARFRWRKLNNYSKVPKSKFLFQIWWCLTCSTTKYIEISSIYITKSQYILLLIHSIRQIYLQDAYLEAY